MVDKIECLFREYALLKKYKENKAKRSDAVMNRELEWQSNLDDLFDIAHARALEGIKIEEDHAFLLAQREPGRCGKMADVDKSLVKRESAAYAREQNFKRRLDKEEVESLEGCHKEADTRTILHCVRTTATSIVVSAKDTDILVMLIAYFHLMACHRIWMKAGTAKKRKFIQVHGIVEHLQMNPEVLEILPCFHALTGSDTTSYLAGHSKKTCWEVFKVHHDLLRGLENSPVLSNQTIKDAEKFVCKVYGAANASSTNEVRVSMFVKEVTNDKLPPTSDALLYYIKRSHYRALVWRQGHVQQPVLPPPETMGWKMEETSLIPELSSLPPVPKACEELISCTCSTGCRTRLCSCKKAKIPCIASCIRKTSGELCRNITF